LLAMGVITIAGIHLIRLIQTIRNWDFLAELPGVPLVFLAISGLLWAAIGFPLGVALWQGDPRALGSVRTITVTYIIYDWSSRILAAFRSGNLAAGYSWGFSALLTVILLVWVFWILSRPEVKSFFRRDQ